MGDIGSAEETIANMTRPDVWRTIANLPAVRSVMGRLGPSAVANSPGAQHVVIRAALRNQGDTLTHVALARLNAIGTQEQVFGKLTTKGLIAEGPLKGLTVNTIRSFPDRYTSRMTANQMEWVAQASRIEKAKLAYLTENGIKINLLTFEEGGEYAGRWMMGRFADNGDFIDAIPVGPGPSRPGAKLSQEKKRFFKSEEEGIAEGYRYLTDDETLRHNVQGAYNKIADKRASDWLLNNVPWRTMAGSEATKIAYAQAGKRVEALERVLGITRRAIRGESPPGASLKAIRNTDPELAQQLDGALSLSPNAVNQAIQRMPEEVFQLIKTTKARFTQALSETRLIQNAKRVNQPVTPGEIAGVNITPSELVGTISRMGADERKSYSMLKAIYRNASRFEKRAASDVVAQRQQELTQLVATTERQLLDARKVRIDAKRKKEISAKEAQQTYRFVTEGGVPATEAKIKAPAFAGKIFRGPEAAETTRLIEESLDPAFNRALNRVNQANSVGRYFQLSGDISAATIQLLYLMGGKPTAYSKAMLGMTRSFFDTRFQAKYLADNADIVARNPELILTRRGGTEYTEVLGPTGLLRTGRFKIADKVLGPFQRAFEGAMDVAGIEMMKSLEHLGTTAARRSDIAQFINKFRGITSSSRLGVSAGQRQLERAALLAPNYNRAVAAILFDAVHGGLSGSLARKALARGVTAVVAMGAATSIAIAVSKGEDIDKAIITHMNPASPKFMTWQIMGQNIGPGTKLRSVINLVSKSVRDPANLTNRAMGFGELDYIRNPVINFARAQTSPVISTGWDIFSGADYIGEPTDEGLISFTRTVGENFMPIWIQSVALEGGTVGGRAARGVGEFAGLRAYPRNLLRETRAEWEADLTEYFDIPTDPLERQAQGIRVDRFNYRKRNSDVDAKLFITGQVSSVLGRSGALTAIRLVEENNIDPQDIRAVQEYQDEVQQREDLGLRPGRASLTDRMILSMLKDTDTTSSTSAPSGQSSWQAVSNDLDAASLRALQHLWDGTGTAPLTDSEEKKLRSVFKKHPLGTTNFNVWLHQRLRQAQSNDANSR